MVATLINDVSDTAFLVAAYRAIETERTDALFRDPLAARLAGERGRKIVESMPRSFLAGWTVVIRTCIIDDFIRGAVDRGVDTVVNLGAGLDTRPYRLALPASLRWIEVDYPHMVEFKDGQLSDQKPQCRLERVKLDLANLPARRTLLADINSQSGTVLVLTEGVIPYLSVDEVASLADDLRSLGHFRHWIVDYFSPEVFRYRRRAAMRQAMRNAPFRFEPKDYFGFFAERGWSAKEIRYIAEQAARLSRTAPLPFSVKWMIRLRSVFMSHWRRDALRKSAAYVLFEPAAAKPGGFR